MSEIIREEDIKKLCALSTTFSKGEHLFCEGAVSYLELRVADAAKVEVEGTVRGSYTREYDIALTVDVSQKRGKLLSYTCECEAFKSYAGICKHLTAALLEFDYQVDMEELQMILQDSDKEQVYVLMENGEATDWEAEKPADAGEKFAVADRDYMVSGVSTGSGRTFSRVEPQPVTSPGLRDAMSAIMLRERNYFCREHTNGDVELEVTLNLEYAEETLELRIGRKQMYVVKNIRELLRQIKNQSLVRYGKNLEFLHTQSAFSKESQALIGILMEVRMPEPFGYYGHYGKTDGNRTLRLDEHILDEVLELYEGRKVCVRTPFSLDKELVPVINENPHLPLFIKGQKSGKSVELHFPQILLLEGAGKLYVYWNSCIYRVSDAYCTDMKEILQMISKNWTRDERASGMHVYMGKNQQRQNLSEKDYLSFCSTMLPLLERYMDVTIEDVDFSSYQIEEGTYELYFDLLENQAVVCEAKAIYGEKTHNLMNQPSLMETYRDIRSEYELRTLLQEYLPERSHDGQSFLLGNDDDRLAALVRDGIPQLKTLADVYASEAFKKIRIAPSVNVVTGLSIKGNLLHVSWDVEGMSQTELMDILDAYKRKKKYHRLRNGELFRLEDSGMDTLAEMQEDLQLTKAQLKAGMADVPLYRAMYLDTLMRENSARIQTVRNEEFQSLTARFEELKSKKYELPKEVHAQMRPYQEEGYRWAVMLAELGFGGILADDMGLGKTLQMIAFLCFYKNGPHLVVCPASLVYNWEAELRRFAPSLKVCPVVGTAAERRVLLEHFQEYDILVTSYDLLKRDMECYTQKSFGCQIIDEAQYIKNPATQAARAVKSIESRVRFALTGTPIENRLSELWSIFEYLMPGYLYSYKHFKETFEEDIVQGTNEHGNRALARLHRMIQPFLMRRLKKDVLKELPDKMEEVVYSGFDREQEKLYKAAEKKLLMSLRKSSEKEWKENKLQILAEITRLRQICCEPSLLYENYSGGSAKLDTCLEMLESAVEGGHKVLVFSQFTSMLDVLAQKLKTGGIRYFMLTGSTSKTKRRNLVERFQDNQADVFLISLKAGGTGLNLTAADMVIHYDPWWNVAAQNQATDRAHRIGQENVVTVMKLIAKDTIEERILKLQEQKQELADRIISEEGIHLSAMSKEQLLELFERA